MDTKRNCRNFPCHKCIGANFCDKFDCTRHGALNQAFESSPIGIAFVDSDGKFLVANKSYRDILGYETEELTNISYIEITHKDDLNKDYDQAIAVRDGKMKSYDMEKRYIRKDGSIVWSHIYVHGVFGEDSNFQYYVVHAVDIDRFRQQKDLTNFAAEVGGVGIWVWNESEDTLYWNKEMYKMYGVDKKTEIVYNTWAESLHPDDRCKIEKKVFKSMKNGEIFNTYFRIVVNGKIKYIKAKASKTGSPPHRVLTGCNIDVTEFVQMQKELDKSSEELEYFTYSVSHDLKSPLVTLSGFSSIISHELNEDAIDWHLIKDSANEIQKATKSLAATIDSILHLSRVGRIYIEKTIVDTKELVEEVIHLNSAKIKESKVQINNSKNLNIFVQKEIFLSVVQNLIVNSIEHAKVPNKNLIINIDFEENDDAFYLIYSDNGKGMSKLQLDNLFNYNNRQYAKGFGMMIIKKGIDFHEGDLNIKSEEGKGTQFKVKFSHHG